MDEEMIPSLLPVLRISHRDTFFIAVSLLKTALYTIVSIFLLVRAFLSIIFTVPFFLISIMPLRSFNKSALVEYNMSCYLLYFWLINFSYVNTSSLLPIMSGAF